MSTARTNSQVFRDPSWLHWAATIPLLAGHIAGTGGCLEGAVTLCVCMALYMWTRTRSVMAMPVQVRIAYVALLAVGTSPGVLWVHYVQLIGTTAMLLFGYCPLVRMLTLLPWNRMEPISGAWLLRIILAPASGGLFDWSKSSLAAPAATWSCSCALPYPQRPDHVAPWA